VSVTDYDATVQAVIDAARARNPLGVSALAVHGVMTGVLDSAHRWRLNHFDLITPDGQPVRWALNWLHGARLDERVYGPELVTRICEAAAREQLPVFLYGSRPEVLSRLHQALEQRHPGLLIAGTRPSSFRRQTEDEANELREEMVSSGARIVLVGLGCPRQETWVYENFSLLSLPLIAVGAAFDFHAGVLPQAPRVLQDRGLEWAYRLMQEPRRLWRRYLLLNPLFAGLILLQRFGVLRFDDRGSAPTSSENFG
jgi:N-acetylglucosaminyldiphosphoundecaprenol N-acetyl-beta-D-mannosaminyltransferase